MLFRSGVDFDLSHYSMRGEATVNFLHLFLIISFLNHFPGMKLKEAAQQQQFNRSVEIPTLLLTMQLRKVCAVLLLV